MKELLLPNNFNYIAVFLTFRCQLHCEYCINRHGGNFPKAKELTGDQWIEGLNRLRSRTNLPLSLQGGEPTLHKDFFSIVNSLQSDLQKDLLTNLEVDVDEFMANVSPRVFQRDAPYASIRVSYHKGYNDFSSLILKVQKMAKAGYHVGIWEIDHPDDHEGVLNRQRIAWNRGIDYRTKEFLGLWKGKTYGYFKYDGAVNSDSIRSCDCKTSELIIAPNGNIHRCHADLYGGYNALGNIMVAESIKLGKWMKCDKYGSCNACDIKITNNRFQQSGHTSVEIKNIVTPTSSDSV